MKDDGCDPDTLKVSELKEALQQKGLETKGNRAALVARLKKALTLGTNKNETVVAVTDSPDRSGSAGLCFFANFHTICILYTLR